MVSAEEAAQVFLRSLQRALHASSPLHAAPGDVHKGDAEVPEARKQGEGGDLLANSPVPISKASHDQHDEELTQEVGREYGETGEGGREKRRMT